MMIILVLLGLVWIVGVWINVLFFGGDCGPV